MNIVMRLRTQPVLVQMELKSSVLRLQLRNYGALFLTGTVHARGRQENRWRDSS